MFSLNVDKVPPEVTYGWKGKNADLLRDLMILVRGTTGTIVPLPSEDTGAPTELEFRSLEFGYSLNNTIFSGIFASHYILSSLFNINGWMLFKNNSKHALVFSSCFLNEIIDFSASLLSCQFKNKFMDFLWVQAGSLFTAPYLLS